MGALLNRRRYMGVSGDEPLPPGYVRIEYLKKEANDRFPYIIIPIYVHFPIEVKCRLKVNSQSACPILGERAFYDTRKFVWWTSSKKFALNYGNVDTGYIANTNIGDNVVEVHTTNDSIFIDGNLAGSFNANATDTDTNIAIFAMTTAGTPDLRAGEIYIYSLWIKNGDGDVFDLIPVRVGQTGYLYDKVSKQLFGNMGGSSFTLGPDKT